MAARNWPQPSRGCEIGSGWSRDRDVLESVIGRAYGPLSAYRVNRRFPSLRIERVTSVKSVPIRTNTSSSRATPPRARRV